MMKKTLAFFTLLLGCVAMFAQSGPTFPYQAVVRNSQNQLIKDSTFAIGVEVYQGADLKYSETQRVTTNANGQFMMNIGGGTVVSGAMGDIADWSVAKFKITYHLSEGDIVSEDFVHPVPYALQAANNAALTELLNTMNARMDSLDHLVDSLSNLNHGGGTTAFTCGTSKVKDVDGNEYNTVQIGNQCWMKENLRTNVGGGVYPKRGNETVTGEDTITYGRLYTWTAMMNGSPSSNEVPSGVKGICPTGWHVPSDAEWDTLTTYVSSKTEYQCDNSADNIAKALSSTTGWSSNTSDGCNAGNTGDKSNATGFSALPAGNYYNDSYTNFGNNAYFWSATEHNSTYACSRYLYYYFADVNRVNYNKNDGYSVRCLRDAGIGGGDTPSTPGAMSCEQVMDCLGDTLSRLNAKIEAQGTEIQNLEGTVTTQGQTIETLEGTVTTQGETIDSLNHIVDSLSDLSHGSFTCGISKVTDIDGNEYHTVQIGTQCWMKENLRTTKTPTGNDITSGMWNAGTNPVETHSENSVEIYGRLYDWTTVMNGLSSSDDTPNGVQGICPDGWHVPSDTEWKQMEMAVGMSQTEADATGPRGDIAAKLSGNTGWYSSSTTNAAGNPNAPDRNSSGFSALPAGFYINSCALIGSDAVFWSATEFAAGIGAYTHSLSYSSAFVDRGIRSKAFCYSVRCVRDTETGGGTPATPATMSCEDVMECLGDTLDRLNARITSQGTEIESLISTVETLSTTVTTQSETIDSLNHIVDSLSDLSHGGGSTPSAIFFCDSSTVKDVDQNEYHTVAIGNQCWMKENLRTKTHTYGSVYTNPNIDSVIYGRYYDWEAIMQVADANSSDFTPTGIHQGICPTGWHVPSQAEWNTLISYVNSETGYKCDGNNDYIANALSSDTGWESPDGCCAGDNSFTLNKTGFSAVPSGYKFFQTDSYIGNGWITFIGSSTQSNSQSVRILYLRNDDPNTNTAYSSLKMDGVSVRCLRDAGIVGNAGSNESGIGSGGSHSAPDGGDNDCCSELSARLDSLENVIDSLANVINNGKVADGQPCPGVATVSDADGNTYNTVKIGSQCWMKENLRKRPTIGNSWNPGGDEGNVAANGLLYDWTAVMQVADANNTLVAVQDKHQGICPNDWHVPSQAEWETLSHYTFDNYRCTDCEEIDPIWQSDRADCVAKALCSAAWNDGGSSCNANSNAIGKNVTGFSILPAGARFGEPPGSFGANAYFWSSTQHNGTTANSWFLGAFASSLNSYTDNKPAGLSLRCIRD